MGWVSKSFASSAFASSRVISVGTREMYTEPSRNPAAPVRVLREEGADEPQEEGAEGLRGNTAAPPPIGVAPPRARSSAAEGSASSLICEGSNWGSMTRARSM